MTDNSDRNEKQHCMMIIHIQSIVLMLVMLVLLVSSIATLEFSIMQIIGLDPVGSFTETFGAIDQLSGIVTIVTTIFEIFNTVRTIVLILSLVLTVVLLYLMKKQIDLYKESKDRSGKTVKVKKLPYVLWGFLLGMYGAHYFYQGDRSRGRIMLIIGLVGTFIMPILSVYTMGMSFGDAYLACFLDRDSQGYVGIEEYPYWI